MADTAYMIEQHHHHHHHHHHQPQPPPGPQPHHHHHHQSHHPQPDGGRVPTPSHSYPLNMTKGSMMMEADCRVTSSLAFHPSDPYLPPCRVCSEKASGFHYGVNTCEACKGFFRRSLTRKDQYKCSGNKNCEILPGKRTSCPYCRFQKCISVGMSKDAIKTGRYTLEKRTKNIEEVKKLISKQKREEKQAQDALLFDPELRARQLDHIIEQITAVHMAQSPIPEGFLESIPEKERHYLEQRALQEKMFGPMKPISREDYFRIYKETGIDIDGRREMVTNMVPAIEKSIKKLIVFAKVLPGFKELPINDQIALIKDCRFEVWMLAGHKAINPKEKLYTNLAGITIQRDDLMKINDEEFVSEFFRAAGLLRKLNLTNTDIALLKGITLLSRDRVALKNPDSVEVSQHVLLDALEYHVQKTRPEAPHSFAHFILCLMELRTLVHTHAKAEEKMTLEWSDIKYPPLLLEMWSTNTDNPQPE